MVTKWLWGVSRYGPWSAWLLVGVLCGCTHAPTTEEAASPVEDVVSAELASGSEVDPPQETPVAKTEELGTEKLPEAPIAAPVAAPVEEAPVKEAVTTTPAVESYSGFSSGIAGTSMGPGLPEAGALMVYVVRPKDTLSMVAKRVYGDAKQWKELARLAHAQNPNLIFPGDVLYYPLTEKTKVFAQTQVVPVQHRVVKSAHTTLAKISKDVYGTTSYWKMIWRENGHIENPFDIQKGAVVYYPAKSMLASSKNRNKVTTQEKTQTTTKNPNPISTDETDEETNETQTGA